MEAQKYVSKEIAHMLNGVVETLPPLNIVEESSWLICWQKLASQPEDKHLVYQCAQECHMHVMNISQVMIPFHVKMRYAEKLAHVQEDVEILTTILNVIFPFIVEDEEVEGRTGSIKIAVFNVITSLIESSLGDLVDDIKSNKTSGGGNVMLSVLLSIDASSPLINVLPIALLRLLRVLMLAEYFNLRNLSWHGFLCPHDLPSHYLSLCFMILVELSHIKSKQVAKKGVVDDPPKGGAYSLSTFLDYSVTNGTDTTNGLDVEEVDQPWVVSWWQRRPLDMDREMLQSSSIHHNSILDKHYFDSVSSAVLILSRLQVDTPASPLSSSSSISPASASMWCQLMLIPVIEHALRCLFVDTHCKHISVRTAGEASSGGGGSGGDSVETAFEVLGVSKKACHGQYYATLDGFGQRAVHQVLLDPDLHYFTNVSSIDNDTEEKANTLGNQLYRIVPLSLISSLLDLIVHSDGPRLRAKLSHYSSSITSDQRNCHEDFTNSLLLMATWVSLCHHFKTKNDEGGSNSSTMVTATEEDGGMPDQMEAWCLEAYQYMIKYEPQHHPCSRLNTMVRNTSKALQALFDFTQNHVIALKFQEQETLNRERGKLDVNQGGASGGGDDDVSGVSDGDRRIILSVSLVESSAQFDIVERASKVIDLKDFEPQSKKKRVLLPGQLAGLLANTLFEIMSTYCGVKELASNINSSSDGGDNGGEAGDRSGCDVVSGIWIESETLKLLELQTRWEHKMGGCNTRAQDRISKQLLGMMDPHQLSHRKQPVHINDDEPQSNHTQNLQPKSSSSSSSSSTFSSSSSSSTSSWDETLKELSTSGLNAAFETLSLIHDMATHLSITIQNVESHILVGKARERQRKNLIGYLLTLKPLYIALKFLADITISLFLLRRQPQSNTDLLASASNVDINYTQPVPQRQNVLLGRILIAVVGLSTCILPPKQSPVAASSDKPTGAPSKTLIQCIPIFVDFLQSKHMTFVLQLIQEKSEEREKTV